ncbi:MAG TPA: lysine--tRNA ligase [Candidatus Baltobacteraceae bacterium]|nr:lysine--tRNA ligase [Candidatus Baltobacteraceae bacterium]
MEGESSAAELRELISSLPYSYKVTDYSAEIKAAYEKYEGKAVSVAGRLVGFRKSGKLIFADLQDSKGKIQIFIEFSAVGEHVFEQAKRLNAGDIIGASGTIMKTNNGEISVKAAEYSMLAKAIRMLPDKWHGIQDVETRYRKRHLDLIMNPDIKEVFVKRSKTIRLIQAFLDKKGFTEFETPVIQPLYGGADAEPFRTQVNTLNESHYLRISDELYLKRLIIGGFDRVYEICRDFRNEDIDSTHSPEFTMIEWYQAYADYKEMMRLTEGMINSVAMKILGTDQITYLGKQISLKKPFKRISFIDSINEKAGTNVLKLSDEQLFAVAEGKGIRFEKGKRNRAHAYGKLFDVLVQPELEQPTFVIDFPRETSPLTRPKRGKPKLVERFELFISGLEIANSYSELNNPIIQRENFEAEMKKAEQGDKEAEPLDMDFIEAMEQGMPPTGGVGLGIDRLVMLLTDKASIKEVILFPMERRGSN